MKMGLRFAPALAVALLAAATLNAQNVVVQWNAIASTTIVAIGKGDSSPSTVSVWR